MNPAPSPAFYEPPLAAKPQLREKPHQGLPSKNPTWNQGPNVCNFTVTLGLRATVVENGVGETYSARYYNPATGRFLSRDPEGDDAADGDFVDPEGDDLTNPSGLHKYLYANGDPANYVDPDGQYAAEYPLLTGDIATHPVVIGALVATGAAIECAYMWLSTDFVANALNGILDQDEGTVTTVAPCMAMLQYKGHRTGNNPEKHSRGEGRRGKDYGGEKGDARRGYPKFPPGDDKGKNKWKGSWPPPPWAEPKSPPYPSRPWWPKEPPKPEPVPEPQPQPDPEPQPESE